MCQNILVEMHDGSRHLVKIPTAPENQLTATDILKSIGFRLASWANVIIDLDKQIFIKSRYNKEPEVSHYEMKYFLSGPFEYHAGPYSFTASMKFKYRDNENLYRHW